MLFTNYLLPLIPLTGAISLHGLTRKSHSNLALRIPAAVGNGTIVDRAVPVAPGQKRSQLVTPKNGKTKRVVRRANKKRACKAPSQPSANATIGNGFNAVPVTSSTASSSATSAASTPSPSAVPSSGWTMTDNWSGWSFFDHWDFWSYDDPTHGTVDYQDLGQSWDQGLVGFNDKGHAIMKVDTTQQVSGRGRKAVRLHGKKVFTGGLIIMDAWHMPTGCGTWPAWWMNGPNWPYGGEIDILEGVNVFTQNQVSIHTGSGCHIPSNSNDLQTGTLTTGSFDSYNCASYETSNQGCGVRDLKSGNSYGKPFNDIGGGVYATLWAKNGIRVWWFPRYAIPADITAEKPNPANWGSPIGTFVNDQCDPYKFFYDNFNIFTNTFCGDWAGADGIWNYAGWAGQDQSCAAITGYSKCSDYVMSQGSKFTEAFWEISYVKYFTNPALV